jgi:poly-gamma-glutamate capsule biosynthesis protein CapA/YwtB (metallophosphatase superfamily)
LTGNHILDWGYEPLLYTLKLYENHNIPYFGGGRNLEEAQRPLILDNHGEELLFVGCSPAGPQGVWATEDLPGSNPCNWDLITEQIRNALEKKMIPIITFQHIEVEDYVPHSSQRVDFLRAANAGAVIVSGSQSHFAQSITFVGDHFVHYGLGNLFFDQMYGENPHEFVDKHYFYNGRYISTELITLTLEDSAKPRLMTTNERAAFLQTIFDHSDWKTVFQEGGE